MDIRWDDGRDLFGAFFVNVEQEITA